MEGICDVTKFALRGEADTGPCLMPNAIKLRDKYLTVNYLLAIMIYFLYIKLIIS